MVDLSSLSLSLTEGLRATETRRGAMYDMPAINDETTPDTPPPPLLFPRTGGVWQTTAAPPPLIGTAGSTLLN